jgi:hypothetical protein
MPEPSSVAALRYLHAVEGRDKEIAQNLSRDGGDALAYPPVPAAIDEAAQWTGDLGEGCRGPASWSCRSFGETGW